MKILLNLILVISERQEIFVKKVKNFFIVGVLKKIIYISQLYELNYYFIRLQYRLVQSYSFSLNEATSGPELDGRDAHRLTHDL